MATSQNNFLKGRSPVFFLLESSTAWCSAWHSGGTQLLSQYLLGTRSSAVY